MVVLKEIGFKQMSDNSNKWKYENKMRDMGQEMNNLQFIASNIRNWATFMLNVSFLRKEKAKKRQQPQKQLTLKEMDIDSLIASVMDKLDTNNLEVLAPLIEEHTIKNRMGLLYNELNILTHLKTIQALFTQYRHSPTSDVDSLSQIVILFMLFNAMQDRSDYKVSDPQQIAILYRSQLFQLGKKTIKSMLQSSEYTGKYNYNFTQWQCFHCATINDTRENRCVDCQMGFNPMYFANLCNLDRFSVDPNHFGIFLVRSCDAVKCIIHVMSKSLFEIIMCLNSDHGRARFQTFLIANLKIMGGFWMNQVFELL